MHTQFSNQSHNFISNLPFFIGNMQTRNFNRMLETCRDETLEALSDAQIVAPAAKTVDLHSANHRNSFLYVFDYQTKFGDFPQVNEKKCRFL